MSRAKIAPPSPIPDYVIELMTEHDLLEVVQIEHACALSKWGWDAYYSELANGALMMVARLRYPDWKQNCLIKGFAAARLFSDQMHINNIGVRPEYQRCGIGRALLRAALTTAYRAGARVAHLEVRPSNAGAIALYARHQFRVVGRRPKYYVEPPEDALLMSAEIAG